MRLRSVELEVADAEAASDFLEQVWGLIAAGREGATRYFRGTGDRPYILAVTAAAGPAVTAITFSGAEQELDRLHARAQRAAALAEAREDRGLAVRGPEGQLYRFVPERQAPVLTAQPDKPVQLSHVVLNSVDVAASERFALEVLGFSVSDRTRMMSFVRCDRKHHCIAYARADVSSVNHIAFELRDLDAVMRAIGRMRDAGYACAWGPGRHGPGNNVFAYFIAPFGAVIEYTAEVSEVGEDHRVGGPDDWQWPPGRTDHWGISSKDTTRLAVAERQFRFQQQPQGRRK
jgi:catechol 2,3-dioxygenase-like lactoylglutathione lyase family enzyme